MFFTGVRNNIRSDYDVHKSIKSAIGARYDEIKNLCATPQSDCESHYPALKDMYEYMFSSCLSQQPR